MALELNSLTNDEENENDLANQCLRNEEPVATSLSLSLGFSSLLGGD